MENLNWYIETFFQKMKTVRKGPLVVERKTVAAMAADTTIAIAKYVMLFHIVA
jgi:chitin synthase